MQEYNCLLTKDEKQTQFTLQIISEHKKLYPDSTKPNIMQGLGACSPALLSANEH